MSSADLNGTYATSQATSEIRIAIVGGGIGGLCTALSIAKYCPGLRSSNITVFEQASEYKEIGAGVSIGIPSGRVLQKLGVYEAVDAISGHRTNVHRSNHRWDTDELIVDAPAANSGGPQEEIRQLWLHRAEFLEVLHNEIRQRKCATLKTNKKVVSLEDHGSTVTLRFADGTKYSADLVIGCDGIHSAVRAQFVGDNPTYSGRIAFRGIIPASVVADDWGYSSWTMSWVARNKHLLAFPISGGKLINIVAFVVKPENELRGLQESWKNDVSRKALEDELTEWCPMVRKLIQAMPATISEWRINDREVLSQWVYMNGKIVLMGDAAHAMLPNQGSGAGLSIEDANVLGFAVRDYLESPTDGLQTYMEQYQRARLHRAHNAQTTSRQAAATYDLAGPDFDGKNYEECLPILKQKVAGRMAWLWFQSDLEADWEAARAGVVASA